VKEAFGRVSLEKGSFLSVLISDGSGLLYIRKKLSFRGSVFQEFGAFAEQSSSNGGT